MQNITIEDKKTGKIYQVPKDLVLFATESLSLTTDRVIFKMGVSVQEKVAYSVTFYDTSKQKWNDYYFGEPKHRISLSSDFSREEVKELLQSIEEGDMYDTLNDEGFNRDKLGVDISDIRNLFTNLLKRQ